MVKKKKSNWIFTTLLIVLAIFLVFSMLDAKGTVKEIDLTTLQTVIEEGKVDKIETKGGKGYVLMIGSDKAEKFPNDADFYFTYASNASLEAIVASINEYNKDEDNNNNGHILSYKDSVAEQSIVSIIMPYVIYIGGSLLILLLVFKMFSKSNQGAMSFGKNKARMSNNIKVKFTDIAGADEEKEELKEIVEFLKNPQKFKDIGARIPKGVLLVGNPGTGKTLLARAVAGESNVPFLQISGSDFVEMFVGVGASRVRDLFDQAKKMQPCIVFIDEIDAVGRKRGAGIGGGNDEREQTLNQLLVEMDGFEANTGIIVLAATNRADVLDNALLRPGRFDRQIYVHNPDVKGREGIIKIHARNKKLAEGIDFTTLARITSGFTGADLENMLNEAAILAARNNRPQILMTDIQEGINKVLMGPQKKSLVVTESDKLITAYHEAGHAVLGKVLEHCEDVQEVSIIPRGNAAGYTMSRPDNDDNHMSKNKILDTIAMTMGGRISEELFMKDIATGASGDIKSATRMARKMVTAWGMSNKFGFMGFETEEEMMLSKTNHGKNEYSEETAYQIDKEIKDILDANYTRATKLLKENAKIVEQMSLVLLEKNTIYKTEVDMLMQGKTKEEVCRFMDEQEQERAKKEKEVKALAEKEQQIKEIEQKLNTAKAYLKEGIISQKDFDLIMIQKQQALKHIEEVQLQEEQPQNNENTQEQQIAKSEKSDVVDCSVETQVVEENLKEENSTQEELKEKEVEKPKTEKKVQVKKEKKDGKKD